MCVLCHPAIPAKNEAQTPASGKRHGEYNVTNESYEWFRNSKTIAVRGNRMISYLSSVSRIYAKVRHRRAASSSNSDRSISPFAAGSRSPASIRLRLLMCIWLCATVPFASHPATAQGDPTLEAGVVPYRSYQAGQFDRVDTLNGNVVLHIPLVSFPQRGRVHLSFSVVMNSSKGWAWSAPSCNVHGVCTETSGRTSVGPTIVEDGTAFPSTETIDYAAAEYNYYSNVVTVSDASGGSHPLGYDASNSAHLRSTDGSGYLYVPANPNLYQTTAYLSGNTGWGTDGVLYTSDGVARAYGSNGGEDGILQFIKDLDGNTISYALVASPLSGTYTDTLNRTIPDPVVALTSGPFSMPPPSTSTTGCPTISSATYQPLVGSYAWSVPGPNGGPTTPSSTYLFCYTTVYVYSPSETDGVITPYVYAHNALQSVVLPNGTYWGFIYDASNPSGSGYMGYGDLLQVTTPAGGSVSYTYGEQSMCPTYSTAATRALATRITNDGQGHSFTWIYTYQGGVVNNYTPTLATTITDQTSGSQTVYNYQALQSGTCSLMEMNHQVYAGAAGSSQLLSTVSTTSYQSVASPQNAYDLTPAVLTGIFPTTQTNTLDGTNTTKVGMQYDSGFQDEQPVCYTPKTGGTTTCENGYLGASPVQIPLGKTVQTTQYDYGMSGSPGALLRTTNTSYLAFSIGAYLNANLLNLPSSVTVLNGSNAQVANTQYCYDSPGGCGTSTSALGHATSVSQWISGSTYATTNYVWNANGTLWKQLDPNGTCTTMYTYSSTYDYAYPTSIASCPSLTTTYTYDYNTGQVTQVKDANQQPTNYSYDQMGRLLSVGYPDGGTTSYTYSDNTAPTTFPFTVTTSQAISPSTAESTEAFLDGFGRPYTTKLLSDPEGVVEVDTTYDELGRVQQVSNPFRSTSDSTYGYTTYTYDALSRKTSLTHHPDNTVEKWCYDGLVPAGQGNCQSHYAGGAGEWVDSADENGNDWEQTTNALGQLTSVIEPNGSSASPSMTTNYTYDVLSNLLSVSQWGTAGNSPRSRSFSYDGLSRLVAASNPENASAANPPSLTCAGATGSSWTTCYSYDLDSNLTSKIDNRPVTGGNPTISYSYDTGNRLLSKIYGDGATPSSCYQYGTSSSNNSAGRLLAEWTQYGSCPGTVPTSGFMTMRTIAAYDPMGRVQSQQECTPNASGPGNCTSASPNPFTLSYVYNLAGNPVAYTNGVNNVPSVGTIAYGLQYDGAGRLQNLSSSWNSATGSSGSSLSLFTADPTVGYSAPGAIQNMVLGDNIFVNKTYDSRLRTTSETASHP